jgi:galactokinase
MTDNATPADDTASAFAAAFGELPDVAWSAPGRVNLIGEHTDYNAGLVLPFAIGLRTHVAVGRRTDNLVRVRSREHPRDPVDITVDAVGAGSPSGWAGYAAGVVAVLERRGHPIDGADIYVAGDVPEGAGLSSSAALECAVAAAVLDAYGLDVSADEVAVAAHETETTIVGVPCGEMDQQVVSSAREGHAMLLDCATGKREHVPFAPASAGLSLLVVDTLARHRLADGAYADRRRRCEDAARALGVAHLSDLSADELQSDAVRNLPDPLRRASRHLVTENDRVRRAVALMRDGDLGDIGQLLLASHASLRDDLEVSCRELDLAVDALGHGGAIGARLTGAGFGGSVIALVPEAGREQATVAVTAAFERAGLARPAVRQVTPSPGLRKEPVGTRT